MKNILYAIFTSVVLCVSCTHKETNHSSIENAPNSGQSQPPKSEVAEVQGPLAAQTTLKPAAKHKTKGIVHFTQSGDKIRVEAMLEGLKPGPHGFHIHEKGDCSGPEFASAGGHFNPGHKPHGGVESTDRHAGDLGNIVADSKGKAKLTLELSGLAIGGEHGVLGKSVIVHEKADDFKTQPTGNSGGRVACGVINGLK